MSLQPTFQPALHLTAAAAPANIPGLSGRVMTATLFIGTTVLPFLPIAILTRPAAMLVVAFAGLSVLARSLGILRWLTVMPGLAAQHGGADPSQRQVIETVFSALTSYGGGIGERLGVSLFMGLALVIAMLLALFNKTLPRWLAVFGLLSAALLLGLFLPAIGIAVRVPIAVAGSVLSVWMLAAGVVLAPGTGHGVKAPAELKGLANSGPLILNPN